jgi:hypothetical protein
VTIAPTPGALKKFKRSSWRFQQTVKTPLPQLDRFVSVIWVALGGLDCVSITLDEVIKATNIQSLFSEDISNQLGHDTSIRAEGKPAANLLQAAFADWVDFLCVPTPKPFVIYADHDEYTTFYANSKSALNQIIIPLRDAGFTMVPDWTREF